MPLDTTQHEWFKDHVETPQLVLVELAALILRCVLDILREPLVELVVRVEQARHDEVQESPQFCKVSAEKSIPRTVRPTLHIILDRSTSQQQSVSAVESKERLPPSTR